jgi:hypothetical protein
VSSAPVSLCYFSQYLDILIRNVFQFFYMQLAQQQELNILQDVGFTFFVEFSGNLSLKKSAKPR